LNNIPLYGYTTFCLSILLEVLVYTFDFLSTFP
jgi:hypothetical protein